MATVFTPPPPPGAPQAQKSLTTPKPGRQESVRPAYIELKANVHRKLLNRLNLEALATADRARA
jgi:hypothetical protein